VWNEREMMNEVMEDGTLRRRTLKEIYGCNSLLAYHQQYVQRILTLSAAATLLVFCAPALESCKMINGEKTFVKLSDGTNARLEYSS
jgi:hypothetical protein